MTQVKKCLVYGCNEPRFRNCTRCHEHQKEEWKRSKADKPARVLNEEQSKNRLEYQRKRQQIKLLLERGSCAVDGCEKPCAKKSQYCMAHRKQLNISAPKRKYNVKVEVTQVVENMPILADLPRLVVIHKQEAEYIEYVPVKRVKAKSERSLNTVKGILTNQKGWLVLEDNDNG